MADAHSNITFEPLLDSTEAATLLGIHPKTLQKMARAGSLPGIRLGDLWRFRASELDAWINSALHFPLPLVP
ncbi:MAG: helix-turn-helix domain-containing protein [Acidobacteriia bacterium]|nr:helix-turn-helix domain-containing protein [Terriglobia bacterium]